MVKAFIEASGDNVETSPSLYVFFDRDRYLFECGEGTQRYVTQRNSFSLAKLNAIFLSSLSWDSVGGVMGSLLTMSDIGTNEVVIYAPVGFSAILQAAKPFLKRSLIVHVKEVVSSHQFQDESLRVQILPISNKPNTEQQQQQQPSVNHITIGGNSQSSSSSNNNNNKTPQSDDENESSSSSFDPINAECTTRQGSPQSTILSTTTTSNLQEDREDQTRETKRKKTEESPEQSLRFTVDQDTSSSPEQHKSLDSPRKSIDSDVVHCYIVRSNEFAGTFLPDKAKELGIRPGPLFKRLVAGESLTNQDGILVHPHQVMEPASPSSNIGIIRCPTIEYIQGVIGCKEFSEYFRKDDPTNAKKILTVFHIAPKVVLNHPDYLTFIERFGDETKHIIMNQESCQYFPSFQRSEQFVTQLSLLTSSLFPSGVKPRQVSPILTPQNEARISPSLAKNMLPINKITRVTLGPPKQAGEIEFLSLSDCINDGLITTPDNTNQQNNQQQQNISEQSNNQTEDSEMNYKVAKQVVEKCVLSNSKFSSQMEEIKSMEAKLESMEKLDSEMYPRILFTGTGSAIPSLLRNVTGHHVLMETGAGMLLDAGEGTFGQMSRFYGPDKIDYVLAGLRVIWISHLHADHHLGTPGILQKRLELEKRDNIKLPPVIVIAPQSIITWLNKTDKVRPLGHIGISIDRMANEIKTLKPALIDLGIVEIINVPVIHCYKAFGIVVTLKNGFKFTYSGDTRPCPLLASEGKSSDVLLHEATMSDDLWEEAIKKRHSTVGEALKVGKDMGAKFTILTHFSQRYPKMPQLEQNQRARFGLAFDLLQVAPFQYPLLESLIQPANTLAEFERLKDIQERNDTVSTSVIPKKVGAKQKQQQQQQQKQQKRKQIDNDDKENEKEKEKEN
ncbi:hypothetical protein DFA_03772 [Cavenderia fasciculata]|uniref:ribonuclease Z n=1 Tax=Cavenderia fasciculata TaxID=261658 RepID=F4Q0C7_CACFS|nr:uncharacterized protein DFA_03772 [Cavenderia fasciculata]EGG18278.1 hypothetical protein DFA_03772 [Cavenderia fasciculata]|eukprot:XP_004357101.1 hypothetical protein DFA_03772 [Cavenderia fasciculata]